MSYWGRIKILNISARHFVKVEQEDNITTQTESEISVKAGLEDLDIEDTFLAVIKMDFLKECCKFNYNYS